VTGARAVYHSLDEPAIEAIGRLFGADPTVEPYSPDGSPVFRVTPGGAADGVTMVLWPSLRRVDVSSTGHHGWVMKNVGSVDLIPGVEVVFHPAEGSGFLFVSVNGWVNMVMG
jgi:hypothetical protein